MRGIPTVLNSKVDYEYIHARACAGKLPAAEVRNRWRGLLATQYVWVERETLAEGEAFEATDTRRVITKTVTTEAEPASVVRVVLERQIDLAGRIFRLGFSVEDVTGRLAELEAGCALPPEILQSRGLLCPQIGA